MKKDFPLFWKWIGNNELVVISPQNVHHWNVDENTANGTLTQIFSRTNEAPFNVSTIINYHMDQSRKSHIIVTLSKERNSADIRGFAQFYHEGKLEVIPAHAANFFQFTPINETESQVLLITAYHLSGTTGELSIRNLSKNHEERKYSFPLYSNEDFPVIVEQCEKLGIVYVISKFGGVYLFDIETGALLYRDRITTENIFCGVAYTDPSKRLYDGVITINKAGHVQSILTNPKELMSHGMRIGQTMVALRIAVRMNLHNASDLWWAHFDHLLKEKKKAGETLKLVFESPKGMLRTQRALDSFQEFGNGVLLQYYKILSQRNIELNEDELEKASSIPEISQLQLKRPLKNRSGETIGAHEQLMSAITKAQNNDQISQEFDEEIVTVAINNSLWDELISYSSSRANVIDQLIIEKLIENEQSDIISYGLKKPINKGEWIHSILEPVFGRKQYERAQSVAIYLLQVYSDLLQNIIDLYIAEEKRLIPIIENVLGTADPTRELYTELAILYSRHQAEQLQDYLEFNASKIDISILLACMAQNGLWNDLWTLSSQVSPDQIVTNIIRYNKDINTWNHECFALLLSQCESWDIVHEALRFYINTIPDRLNNLLSALSNAKIKPDLNQVRQDVESAGRDFSIMSVLDDTATLSHQFVRSNSGTLHMSHSIEDFPHSYMSPPVSSSFDFFGEEQQQQPSRSQKNSNEGQLISLELDDVPRKKFPPIPQHLQKKKEMLNINQISNNNTLNNEDAGFNSLIEMIDQADTNHSNKHKHPHLHPHQVKKENDGLFVHLHEPTDNRSLSSKTPPTSNELFNRDNVRRNRSADHLLLTLDDAETVQEPIQNSGHSKRNASEGRLLRLDDNDELLSKDEVPRTPTKKGPQSRLIQNDAARSPTRRPQNQLLPIDDTVENDDKQEKMSPEGRANHNFFSSGHDSPTLFISNDGDINITEYSNDRRASPPSPSSQLFFPELQPEDSSNEFAVIDSLLGITKQPKPQPHQAEPKQKALSSNGGSLIEFDHPTQNLLIHPHPGYESNPVRVAPQAPLTVADMLKVCFSTN